MGAGAIFELMVGGDFLGSIIRVYTDLLGQWFWVWFVCLSLLMLYLRVSNYSTVGVVALTISIHMFPLFPPIVHLITYIALALSITVTLYRVYH